MKKFVLLALFALMGSSLLMAWIGCRDEEIPVVRVAYASGTAELLHQSAQRFAQQVRELSGDTLRVRLYPSGQLGNERTLVEGLKLRSIDMVITGGAIIGWYAPEYGALEAPFAWRDYDHLQRVWDGPIGEQMRETMRKTAGIDLLFPWFRGPRYLTTTSRKILSPEDLDGLKLRVPELKVYIKSWQTFGANVTPVPFNDMFMALKLGVVEGQENPLATIYGNNLQEVQKYAMETKHLIGFYLVAVGAHFQNRFSEGQRQWLLSAAAEATDWHNREVARSEGEYRRKLEKAGMEFIEVDREAFRKVAVEHIPPLFEKTWKEGLYRQIGEAR